MADELELDACDESFNLADKNTADADIDAVVLFADVDFTDPAAVARRKAEWEEVFSWVPSPVPPGGWVGGEDGAA
jgi:hypothetical protein